jgi:ribonucleoside-diphosphate reductase alpha chain
MIKNIIKRNGELEPFKSEKLNGWGEWAASKLGREIDWSEAVLHVVSTLPETCTSEDLQNGLINFCLDKNTWEYNRMAGRLYAALLSKKIYGSSEKPTVKELHDKLHSVGLMVKLDYSDSEYAQVEKFINHKLDFNSAHYEIHQIRLKYSLRDKVSKKEYETQQFVYMRMAMALAENEPRHERMKHVKNWYDHLSHKRINAPTPNFVNLGTGHNGLASCCVYTTDDTAASLACGDHIAYMMTVMSAGIGTHIKTRSIGDGVRHGLIQHQGKLPYYRAMVGAIGANLQNGRGGASTVHYTAFDPEVEVIAKAKNPMTPLSKQIRGCDYSFGSNKFFARKAAKNEQVGLFSYYDCPEVYEAQYSKDSTEFERLYNQAVEDGRITKFVNARELLVDILNEGYETGRHYLHFMDTMNHHTPFKDKIYSSNLCQEINIPSFPFKNVEELYLPYKEGNGEIGICSLAGIVVSNIDNDEQYADAAYYALKMIDVCIHKSTYIFKNVEDTTKARLSAGVGVLGLAHLMAKKNLKYSTQSGRDFIHELFETHMWHLVNASLRLGKELGNAPWIDKTSWPEGWLPIDTYEKRVDEIVTVGYKRNWETLREKIIENGGIRNSVVAAIMPSESSSVSAGTTNAVYPIRDYDLMKTNETMVLHYVAPDSTKLRDKYELAWDISTQDLIKCYAIMQKWTDQGISADLYRKILGADKVGTKEMIDDYLAMVKYGLKSRYYQNSLTSKGGLDTIEIAQEDLPEEDHGICESCSL